MNKEQLLKEVQNRTEIGKHYAEMQLRFRDWLINELRKELKKK